MEGGRGSEVEGEGSEVEGEGSEVEGEGSEVEGRQWFVTVVVWVQKERGGKREISEASLMSGGNGVALCLSLCVCGTETTAAKACFFLVNFFNVDFAAKAQQLRYIITTLSYDWLLRSHVYKANFTFLGTNYEYP